VNRIAFEPDGVAALDQHQLALDGTCTSLGESGQSGKGERSQGRLPCAPPLLAAGTNQG
jgi:hypothetical protein